MKGLKLGLVIMAAALFTIGWGGMAYAFHSGGVAACDGCHTMHGTYPSGGGAPILGKGPSLLVGTDTSSTCLLCHASSIPAGSASIGGGPTIMTYPVTAGIAPSGFNVGGDFGYLAKTYTLSTSGAGTFELGQTHGHNIIASDFGFTTGDTDYPISPGGGFTGTNLGCNSCHDPHGTYRRVGSNTSWQVGTPTQLGINSLPISGSGSKGAAPTSTGAVGTYRLLAGLGYMQGGRSGFLVGFQGAPLAVSQSTSGVYSGNTTGGDTSPTTQFRVAYAGFNGSGVVYWGTWCGACHQAMVSSTIPSPTTVTTHVHPVDVALSTGGEDAIYNSYVTTGVVTGTIASSFLSLVPFMEGGQSNVDTLTSHSLQSYRNGPAPTDQVSCLSCHRGHASGFKYMLRWDMTSPLITTGPTAAYQLTSEGRTATEAVQAYYGRQPTYFGPYQRVLCNKCHGQD